jgi:tetratricopeptide (TPR) repeat protein
VRGRGRVPAALLALGLLVTALGPAVALAQAQAQAPESGTPGGDLSRAVALLQENDLENARKVIEPALASDPGSGVVQAAAGMLRFYEQRYPEAVDHLERAQGEGVGFAAELLELAHAGVDITRDYGRIEGEHFVVSYPKGKDEVLVPYVLETLEAQRAALERDLGWAPPGKVTIEILHDTQALSRLSPLTEEEIKTSGTIALCKYNKLMVVSPKALLTGYDWLDTAAHEYVHYVLTRRTHDNAPIWMQEGIAKYEEARWRGSSRAEIHPYAAALLRDAVKRNKLITFAEMHPSMAKLPSQEATALAFAEVATLIEYVQSRGGTPVMTAFLDRVAAGKEADEALAESMGEPFGRLMEAWKRYMAARPLPEGGDRALRRLKFKGDPKHGGASSEWSEVPDEKARGFARLGEIMRQHQKWEAARVEYAKAVQRVGLRIGILSDKYALAALAAGKEDEAEAALDQAAQANPSYAAVHVHRARILVKRKRWADAKAALLLANRTDPFDPEIHAGLATVLAALGDKGGASRETRFAQLLSGRPETPFPVTP